MSEICLYTNGDSVSWGAELENKKNRFSSLISKDRNWFDLNVASAGISNDRIYRTTIRDISKYLNNKEIYCEGFGYKKVEKIFVLIAFTSPTRIEYFDGDVFLKEQLWFDEDRWGDIDKHYITDSKYILENTKLEPSLVRLFNQIISLDSFLTLHNIPHLFVNAFFNFQVKEFDIIKNNLNNIKISSQFDDPYDYFGFEEIYKLIPNTYKEINLIEYLKEKKNKTLLALRGHPSETGHFEIYKLLNNIISYE